MKKSKLFLIISALVCSVLAVAVVVIAHTQPKHKHHLGDAKIYHISNDGVHYTRLCKDGCIERFDTRISFIDVLSTATEIDTIVLDEDITLYSEVLLKSFVTRDDLPQDITLNINLDLNNYKLSTEITDFTNKSMFTLNANYGQINFNIKNGTLYTDDLLYLFRFENNYSSQPNIKLTFDNVECKVVGDMATPLATSTDCSNIIVNATDTKFIASKPYASETNTGVGALINSESVFNFNNCYFEGGDAIYVKRGEVNLNGCTLKNVDLPMQFNESASIDGKSQYNTYIFTAVGACLSTESYKNAEGVFSRFSISVIDCEMLLGENGSTTMIHVSQTLGEGASEAGINPKSRINIMSCIFHADPSLMDYSIVNFANEPEISNGPTWVID